jgi:hypothetical protein
MPMTLIEIDQSQDHVVTKLDERWPAWRDARASRLHEIYEDGADVTHVNAAQPDQWLSALVAAQRGAEWLDDHAPDWRGDIELDDLAMNDPSQCILGQVGAALLDRFTQGGHQMLTGYAALADDPVKAPYGETPGTILHNAHMACIRKLMHTPSGLTKPERMSMGFTAAYYDGDAEDADLPGTNDYLHLDHAWRFVIAR